MALAFNPVRQGQRQSDPSESGLNSEVQAGHAGETFPQNNYLIYETVWDHGGIYTYSFVWSPCIHVERSGTPFGSQFFLSCMSSHCQASWASRLRYQLSHPDGPWKVFCLCRCKKKNTFLLFEAGSCVVRLVSNSVCSSGCLWTLALFVPELHH